MGGRREGDRALLREEWATLGQLLWSTAPAEVKVRLVQAPELHTLLSEGGVEVERDLRRLVRTNPGWQRQHGSCWRRVQDLESPNHTAAFGDVVAPDGLQARQSAAHMGPRTLQDRVPFVNREGGRWCPVPRGGGGPDERPLPRPLAKGVR